MAKSSLPSKKRNNSNLQSGVAGAGSGTLLLLLAKNIPDNYPIKSWLILIAPTVSIILAWFAKKVDVYFKEKKVEGLKEEYKNKINSALNNPYASDQDKEKLKKMLVEIDLADIESISAKIKSIDVDG